MTKHTPGPWEISQEPPRWIIQAEAPIGKGAVAYMVGDYVACAANARLIAAAPDMLAALEMALASGLIRAHDPVNNPGTLCPVHDAITAAIAKASKKED